MEKRHDTTHRLVIKALAEDDRPREKLMKYGAEALSKSELLAILVGSGNGEENAVSLMQRIMHDSGDNLQNLAAKSLDELRKYKGIGTAKAVTIKAACQIAKLMQAENVDKGTQMDSPQKVNDYVAPKLSGKPNEEVWIMLLNPRLQVIGDKQISKGGITESSVDIRLIMREAVTALATSMILVHNHPSGNVSPSREDDRLTLKLAEAGRLMNITLQDHVIVGGGKYFSYRDEGKL